MTKPVVFPTWRPAWAALEGLQPLLEHADELVSRRSRGNHLFPKWNAVPTTRLSIGLEALRRWTGGEPPSKVSERGRVAKNIYSAIAPTLRAAAWPRWLLIEQAFFDGSDTGDVLFSALAVRSMCEEIQRLHSLDFDAQQIEALAASEDAKDCVRFDFFLLMARTSLDAASDPLDPNPSGLSGVALIEEAWPRLQAAKQALNDYVHPNYGSHIAAAFPERSAAAHILLEGIIAAYEAFFALSWAERTFAGSAEPLNVTPAKNWSRTVRRFTKKVLPDLQKVLASAPELNHVDSSVKTIFQASAAKEWLNTKNDAFLASLNNSEFSDLVRSLRQLGDHTGNKSAKKNYQGYRLWEGASEREILSVALVRRSEQILTDEFPKGAPSTSQQQRWFHFISLALQLALALDELKAAAFKMQLVRQIVSGNRLGILMCIRSLLEHKAVAEWLVKRLGKQWDEIGKRVKPEGQLPQQTKILEEAVARFLTGTKGSAEDELPWTMHEDRGRWSVQLSLPTIVKDAFESADKFRQIYDMASAALHGRTYRGIDLLVQYKDGPLREIRLGVLVLEWTCDNVERMDQAIDAFILHTKLEHAAAQKGTAAAVSEAKVKGVFSFFGEGLKQGRDFTGEGTREMPFKVHSHLQYHAACHELLRQLGVQYKMQERARDANGNWCDRFVDEDRDWWFAAPAGIVEALSKLSR